MVTIGADVHLKTSTFSVIRNGERIMKKKLNNDPQEILKFIRQYDEPKVYSMETTYNWPVFFELLKTEVDEFNLLHAKKLKSIVESQGKNDDRDANDIAYLTEVGYIPKAYKANIETRQIRNLLRTYMGVSRVIASLKNRIHAIINANVFYYERPGNFKDLFCKRGREYLKGLKLPDTYRFMIDEQLKQIDALDKIKQRLLDKIHKMQIDNDDIRLLRTAPGLGGKVLVYIVLAEIDRIERYRNARALVAYAGLIPQEKSSGGKIRRGKLRTECNWFLRWALIEAVGGAILKDRGLRAYYKEVKARSNASSAKVAVARKLLKSVYYMLRDRQKYETKAVDNLVSPIAGVC